MVYPNVTSYISFEILSGYEGLTDDYVACVYVPHGSKRQFNASTELSAIEMAKIWLARGQPPQPRRVVGSRA